MAALDTRKLCLADIQPPSRHLLRNRPPPMKGMLSVNSYDMTNMPFPDKSVSELTVVPELRGYFRRAEPVRAGRALARPTQRLCVVARQPCTAPLATADVRVRSHGAGHSVRSSMHVMPSKHSLASPRQAHLPCGFMHAMHKTYV